MDPSESSQSAEINDHELDSNSRAPPDQATHIYQSKMARKVAKANVTRKMKEISQLIKDANNLERVQNLIWHKGTITQI